MPYTPKADFVRWYLARVTCGPLVLTACRSCTVCPNLLEHLQISPLRLRANQPVSKLPAATLLADLHRLEWRTELVLQMPRKRAQLLLAEIPLALRQQHDIAPPGESPLLIDAGAVETLQFYFLQACTPLTAAQLSHLTSPGRLAFSSAPLPHVAKKRPRQQLPTQLGDLVACLRRAS